MAINLDQIIKNLEQLIYEEPDFEKLKNILNREGKSIFHIISKDQDELTFSRTLRYFLDPNEDHHIDHFLRHFLHMITKKMNDPNGLTRFKIDMMDLKNAKVYREYSVGESGRIDIVIELLPELFCAIEVKLFSGEGFEQTDRYATYINQRITDKYNFSIMCFLTPDGMLPRNPEFIPASFTDLMTIFQNENVIQSLNSDCRYLITHFIKWVKELKPMDKNTREICRSIYSRYKDEIKFLIENLPTITSFMNEVENYINKHHNRDYLAHHGTDWSLISPQDLMSEEKYRESKKYTLIRIEYNYIAEKLYLTLVVPESNKVIDFLKENSLTIFGVNYDKVTTWKSWRKVYHVLNTFEGFNPENFIVDWDDQVKEYSKKMVERYDSIRKILDRTAIESILSSDF
jgi:hypothetical protein